MALLNNKYTPFSQEWVDHLKGVPEMFMNAEILIYDPNDKDAISDPQTGEWLTDPITVLETKARVQPRRTAGFRTTRSEDTFIQHVQVQIPIDESKDIRFLTHLRARVTKCDLLPVLETYVFTVQEDFDAGNVFERTLIFQVDLGAENG